MKPKNLTSPTLVSKVSLMADEERFAALGPHTRRMGRVQYDENGNKLPFPETYVQTAPRVKIADLPKGFIPPWMYERNLEQNQLVALCCRHWEEHEIDAGKSHPEEPANDRYNFYCKCGRTHRYFFAGVGRPDGQPDVRPNWEAS